jgi:hypothetical protein
MNALINIGMLRNTEGVLRTHDIAQAFDQWAVMEYKHKVVEAEPEATYIAHVSNWDTDKAHQLAKALDQDCIAQYDLDECEGKLVGPRAHVWGEFNGAFFKLL